MQMSNEPINEKMKLSSPVTLYKWKILSSVLPWSRKLMSRKTQGILCNIENALDVVECDFIIILFCFVWLSEAKLRILREEQHHNLNTDILCTLVLDSGLQNMKVKYLVFRQSIFNIVLWQREHTKTWGKGNDPSPTDRSQLGAHIQASVRFLQAVVVRSWKYRSGYLQTKAQMNSFLYSKMMPTSAIDNCYFGILNFITLTYKVAYLNSIS